MKSACLVKPRRKGGSDGLETETNTVQLINLEDAWSFGASVVFSRRKCWKPKTEISSTGAALCISQSKRHITRHDNSQEYTNVFGKIHLNTVTQFYF